MAAAQPAIALHGGILPVATLRLADADALRPALRMAAHMHQRVIYLLHDDTHASMPACHVAERLAHLRAMGGVSVLTPADPVETAECLELALRRTDAPTVLVLPYHAAAACRTDAGRNRCQRGGYVLAEAEGARQATLIATGPEAAIALAARDRLAAYGIAAAVVSLPSWDIFAQQSRPYRESVLGGAPRFGLEAAGGFGWERWLGQDGMLIDFTEPTPPQTDRSDGAALAIAQGPAPIGQISAWPAVQPAAIHVAALVAKHLT